MPADAQPPEDVLAGRRRSLIIRLVQLNGVAEKPTIDDAGVDE
jgi:hypothetical protein